jgi:lysophospholipase L1-like esterase
VNQQELAQYILKVGLPAALRTGKVAESINQLEPGMKTNMLTKNLFGRYSTTTLTTDMTTNIVMELESDFIGFRIGVHNASDKPVAGVKACVSVRDKLDYNRDDAVWAGEFSLSGSTWVDCTFNGTTSVTLPARLGEERTSITWSDVIPVESLARTDGGKRPVIMIRIEQPTGSVMSFPANGSSNWRATDAPRYFKTSKQEILGVTNKAAFNKTANTEAQTHVPAVQYFSKKAGQQLLISGDSISEGIQARPLCYAASQIVALENSTPDSPIDYFNGALHAQVPLTYAPRIKDMLDVVRPTKVIYCPWSPNDVAAGGITDDALNRARNALANVLEYIRAYGKPVELLLTQGIPCTTTRNNMGANDAKRTAFNAMCDGMTGVTPVVGYADSISGAMNADGQIIPMDGTISSDNAHPSPFGYSLMAKQVAKVLIK